LQYELRVEKIRGLMEKAGTDALVSFYPVNQFYLTGTAQNQLLVFPRQGEPVLLVRRSEDRARHESWVKDIRPMGSMKRDLGAIAGELNIAKGNIGIEYALTSATLLRQLEEALPQAHIVDSDLIWLKAREVKDPEEIENIRKGHAITDEVHRQMGDIIEEGISELEVAARVEYLLRKMGSETTSPLMYSLGGRPLIWRVCTRITSGAQAAIPGDHLVSGGLGLSSAVPHGPSNRRISKGEPVNVNIGAIVQGYISDSLRTYFLGPPSDKLREMYSTVREAQQLFLTHARPGVAMGEVVKRVLRLVEERGYLNNFGAPFPYNGTYMGHGVGLFVNEYPSVGLETATILQPGMVIAVEPRVAIFDLGSAEVGVMIVITEDGNELFSGISTELEDCILADSGRPATTKRWSPTF
jgi:Xaa-Pro dipeptidase